MVDGGKITLRVEVDAREFERFMKKSPKDMTKFEKSVSGATVQTEKLGQTATTTAVRFQTLTQGTINLVTSFTQAYTSISNLQKAKTSLQAAAVGVERAIDLQRRKQFMLNEEMAKAAPNMQKVNLLTNELATAHDDLAVKQQRVKDQADQVNDTYILFGLNIANVGFSAVQTGVSMLQMAKGIKIATIAQKAYNIASSKHTLIALAVIVAWEGIAQAIKTTNHELGTTISIIDNINRLFGEFNGASDITLDHYEDKIGGVTQATKGFEDSWKSMTGIVKGETDNQIAIVKHWEREYKTVVANMRLEMGRQMNQATVLPGGTQGNFPNAQQGSEIKIQEVDKKTNSIIDFIFGGNGFLPAANAELQLDHVNAQRNDNTWTPLDTLALSQKIYNETKPIDKFLMMSAKHQSHLRFSESQQAITAGETIPLNPISLFFGTVPDAVKKQELIGPRYNPPTPIIEIWKQSGALPVTQSEVEIQQARIQKLQMFEQQLMDIYSNNDGRVTASWYTAAGNTSLEIIRLQTELETSQQKNPKIKIQKPKSQDERNLEFMSTFIDENTPNYKLALKGMGSHERHLFTQRAEHLKKLAIQKFENQTIGRDIKIGNNTIRLGITSDRSKDGIFYAGIGSNLMTMTQNMGGTFGMGNRMLGTREGNMIEALRYMQIQTIDPNDPVNQRTMFDVSGFESNNYSANAAELYAYGATSEWDYMDGLSAFGQAAVAAGVVSVSETRGSRKWDARNAKTLADQKIRLAEQDRITNLKRFGGYSSRKAQSEAGKAAFYSSVDEASRMMRFFGDQINSSVIRGRSSRRSEYGRIATKGAMYKSALASAGLSYKTINTRLGSRPDNWRILQFNRDLAEIISYNTNQYAKAETINILQQDFGLTGFTGTTMSLPSLQDRLAAEDERMKSIGLSRTEAFQIIDTVGRGREEIDDRVRFKDRMNSMSTGATVL